MQERTAGLDLASEEHRLVIVDGDGGQVEQRRIPHSEEGIEALIRRLRGLKVARVALEQPNGLVVDRLLDAGITVVPADARGLGEKRLAGFLARNRYSGRTGVTELLERIHRAPQPRIGDAELEARRAVVLALVTALKPLVEQIRLLTSQIAGAIRAHHDGRIFLSLFRDPKSVITAAELLAEIGDNRDRHRSSASLEALAGQAPVAVQSGKKKVVCFRWACNKNLRDAVSVLADSSRKHNPWAADIYQRARNRGHDHPHAIRILGRAWLRVIWRLWQNQTPYDPARHGSLNRLLATEG